jgi:MFS family permease
MIGVGNWAHVARALRHRDHYLFNLTLVPSLTSLWAQRTGIGWLAWDLTHSPAWLGVIAAADLLPSVFLSPFAGVTADRSDAVRMMWLTQAIIMAYSCALWLMTATGTIDIWSLFAFALITGLNQPYSTAARMVFYPTLVPKEDLGTAIAINSTIFNLGRAVGPAVGGLMIGPFGVATLFFLNFACFLVHSVNLLRVKGRHAERIEHRRKSMWREIGDSMGYVARHPGIGPMLVLLTVSSILSRPVADMLPGFADEVFSRGSEGLGWLLGAMGAGGMADAARDRTGADPRHRYPDHGDGGDDFGFCVIGELLARARDDLRRGLRPDRGRYRDSVVVPDGGGARRPRPGDVDLFDGLAGYARHRRHRRRLGGGKHRPELGRGRGGRRLHGGLAVVADASRPHGAGPRTGSARHR